jgi:transposase
MNDPPTKAGSGTSPETGQPALRVDLSMADLAVILEHARTALSDAEFATLEGAMQTLAYLTRELEKKSVSIQRLKQLLFGASTETTAKVVQRIREAIDTGLTPAGETGATGAAKPKGHGRNGAETYVGAQRVQVALEHLHAGNACPTCGKGTVYVGSEPGRIVRLTGQAPIGGTVYELEKLRCNLCGEVFTAETPPGVGPEKYDAESAAMIGLLKYGTGVPFHRLEKLQEGLGLPLPASTQWEIVSEAAGGLLPAWRESIRQAAQGQILHNDDTTMKVLGLGSAGQGPSASAVAGSVDAEQTAAPADPAAGRKGVFTSGIVSKVGDQTVALFFTGHKHAGENLFDLLQRRSSDLAPPIQMCDALSRNLPAELKTLLAHCLAHGRRRFVDVAGNFPEECLHVLEILKVVYANDAIARQRGMSLEERLRFHQAESGPAMAGLKAWLDAQIEQRQVEPNSGLGEAITYLRKHWLELTLFLRVAGAPLDNNICERALKLSILHRKNAYFYKTENGARVGDLFMSLIHTCRLNGGNPFHYLTELQKHSRELAAAPADWMPWNYRATLASEEGRPSG